MKQLTYLGIGAATLVASMSSTASAHDGIEGLVHDVLHGAEGLGVAALGLTAAILLFRFKLRKPEERS